MTSSSKTKSGKQIRARAYLVLFGALSGIWVFMIYLAPWLEKRIPVFSDMATLIEERELNANAYFYTGIEASVDGERYLVETFQLANGGIDFFGFTSGIALCFLILFIGFRLLPLK